MNYYGKSEQVINNILKTFESGNIPRPLAQVFIHRNDPEIPCHKWSFLNQMVMVMEGHSDARGFRQWNQTGRYVKRGETCFYILAPILMKVRDSKEATSQEEEAQEEGQGIQEEGQGKYKLLGFKAVPVFGLEQTEGEPVPKDEKAEAFLDSLPLIEVARSWGLKVISFNGTETSERGAYSQRKTDDGIKGLAIAIGVENLSTWAHELVHAADDSLGNLSEKAKKLNEIVAELGGAVLLECLGYKAESDRGGCWDYIKHWSPENPIQDCLKVINRVCQSIDLILTTADQLAENKAA